ncbi:MAG: replication factor A [Methermicoccaceae archaeon]
MKETAEKIQLEFKSAGVEVPLDEIENSLKELVDTYYVPLEEARRSVVNLLMKKYGVGRDQIGGTSVTIDSISEIDSPNRWINVRGKVVQLFPTQSEVVAQAGMLGDESGFIRFVKWTSADLPELDEGSNYLFKNVVTDYWQGQYSIKLNRTSEIVPLDEDISVPSLDVVKEGAIVAVQQGSGLISRCPECRRVIIKGVCNEHGKVEGIPDLRVKAVLDDGKTSQDILLNRELTEVVTGVTLEDAKKWAQEYLDPSVVQTEISKRILGRYYSMTGRVVGQYLLVEEATPLRGVDKKTLDSLIKRSEELMQ